MGKDIDTDRPVLPEEPTTRVRYAYFIAGSLLLFHSLIFVFLYLCGDETFFIQGSKGKTKSEKIDSNSKCFLISFVSLVFIFNWMYCILEVTCGNYLTAYTVDQLNWSKTAGATLTSVFWTSFTIGRGIGIFIVKWIQTEKLLLSMSFLTIISLIPIVFFSDFHVSIMWVSTVLFGFFLSTIYASGFTFANMYVTVSGGIGALFIAAGSLGDLTGPILIVPTFDKYGMQVFSVLLFVSSVVMLVVLTFACVIGRQHEKSKLKEPAATTENFPLITTETCIIIIVIILLSYIILYTY